METLLHSLNPSQREAVEHIDGAMLILAGAGSGKTKTLTARLAYLVGEVGIDPANTLTLTFTNKAAAEMRERALKLMPNSLSYPPLLCTFHKFGLLFLKFHIEKLGRSNAFVIIDSDDKKRLLRSIAKELKSELNIAFIASEISKYKNSILSPEVVLEKAELPDYKQIAAIYAKYQANIEENNLVDFDDLLMLSYKILSENDELRRETSKRYRYIMVDEYQDTNELQFQLLQLLASEHNNLCVVGDDDQSIYGWRGANIRNILEFADNFSACKTVKLETNYRSTQPILQAANTLIEHNSTRLGKKLTSHKGEGQEVKLLHSLDESMEARAIARAIKNLLESGANPDEIAVLYRINALSRSLEEGFGKEGLSFKLIGGMRFYERAEIKDLISYLRVLSNPHDDFSLLRIINKPKRGIGKASIEKLQKAAYDAGSSLFGYIKTSLHDQLGSVASKKVFTALGKMVEDIETLQEEIHHSPGNFITLFEERINFKNHYAPMPDGFERILNIDEFYGYFRDAVMKNPELSLDEFLNDISLQSDQDQIEDNAITIMSIHAAKGLEFEHLFVIGLEEEFFPLLGEGTNMEEERRLGYVAITRAKSDLTLCYVDSRFYKGRRKMIDKSRFLGEAGLIQDTSLKITKSSAFKKGDLVKHKIFGIGRVQEANKSGKEYKLLINFGGNKKEILSSFVQSI
ncbi:MAG TPA: UvrD-helicase domain-containing protein [Sulfurovum sp.]|jgi:DNA helicase-2/ATP-dependent DNA helicase PcrA|nr:MAG: ATP-dependent DNA helicase [Sulfurovum sp. 35-42-20]OYZ25821.1 MAG: ATP-dependent DNA helicase [Sulfurovum sp. 16-42-52]OYZ49433.1 MAG: ATP-dependent DNA helicase [Sulfurovum sp. 24-42-9]OZA45201.1 MAG: ATP-dependent DNA helicase [Sulfurovum sp. 17-42-90]HQR73622.1 UvrD-helicase domain-containing protein [Sulfurovum sp.]